MAETTTTPSLETGRGHRKERLGEVLSNKMTKTIVVRVERRFEHPKYKKVVTGYKKLYAHDEKSEAKVGASDCICVACSSCARRESSTDLPGERDSALRRSVPTFISAPTA